jgi:hypothetical protein
LNAGVAPKAWNLAAHSSLLEIGQPQADDAVYNLVNNVVLALV